MKLATFAPNVTCRAGNEPLRSFTITDFNLIVSYVLYVSASMRFQQEKALETFSMIVKLQTSRRFVSSHGNLPLVFSSSDINLFSPEMYDNENSPPL